MHALLEPVRRHPRHAQELDPVAELVGEGDVHRRDVADALDVDRVEARPAAEGQRRQQRQLVRGVDAVDVEGGVGLGVAQACASASTSANSRPVSRIVVRMKLQVPLRMP